MSEYGIKIRNIKAGTLYEYNLGVRDYYQSTQAMLSNSLFNDFLLKNGLKVNKSGATRDIVCIEFDFGSRSYEDEILHIEKLKEKYKEEGNTSMLDTMNNIEKRVHENESKYIKKTKEEIREEFYENGVDITYITKNKNGEVVKKEIIHYEMLFRSTGKAKKGACMFIKKTLHKKASNFLRMGIKLKKKNAPIVEIGAYCSLIASGICGKIKIDPSNILVLQDFDSFFETKVISVETDDNKQCIAKRYDNYKLKNTLFDGQALIDESIFPEWGEGYILLRHHFCKMAAFKTKIQNFFKDYYGDKYDTATVKDMFGREIPVKQVQLITTDNAMKWLKFGISYEYWSEWVNANDNEFGIVKTAHESKLGNVQRMSYQMVNALDQSVMEDVVKCSKEYVELMKRDNHVFLDYLMKNANFANDYEPLVALCEQNWDFTRSEYFRDRKRKIIEAYTLNFKSGHINQNADNLVIVGSPYAMLMHSVGENPELDPTFEHEEGTIQCYTSRFNDNEYLAFFRSPFNSKNNMSYLHNHHHPYFDKYFDFGKLIIAVNMVHTDFQDRNNGLTYWVTLSQAYNEDRVKMGKIGGRFNILIPR